MNKLNDINYKIVGDDLQMLEIELEPNHSVIAEAGSMLMMEQGIEMETIFGDGSVQQDSIMGKILGAGKRLITGESLFMTQFTNHGSEPSKVFFSSPLPGKIIAMDLSELGNSLICQKDSFICAQKGIALGIAFTKRLGAGFFGGEGFILQKFEGTGIVFVNAGGYVFGKDLKQGEMLRVDTGCIVGMTESVDYDIQMVNGIKSMLFGGEGIFFATLTGPGKVWLQSLPLSRLANRLYSAATKSGGAPKEEGSILGGLGNLFQDD